MAGKMLAMIFDKPSTRTRVSFEVAAKQLGGDAIVLTSRDMQLGRGETIADTARVLSRYVDAIMIRTDAHEKLLELAAHATVPIINGLTDHSHPCQIMADIQTIEEHRGPDRRQDPGLGRRRQQRADLAGPRRRPPRLRPQHRHPARAGARRRRCWTGPPRARAACAPATIPWPPCAGADAVFADTWVSMGQDGEGDRYRLLEPFRVDERLMAHAAPGALFLHCLPAHRGDEVTAAVIDGPQSVVFDAAENRLHAQKAILEWCLEE